MYNHILQPSKKSLGLSLGGLEKYPISDSFERVKLRHNLETVPKKFLIFPEVKYPVGHPDLRGTNREKRDFPWLSTLRFSSDFSM